MVSALHQKNPRPDQLVGEGEIGSTRELAAGLEHKETSVFHVTRVLECPVVGKGGKQEVRKT